MHVLWHQSTPGAPLSLSTQDGATFGRAGLAARGYQRFLEKRHERQGALEYLVKLRSKERQ
jgi:hypothetical protein